jgi:hypothetical protein
MGYDPTIGGPARVTARAGPFLAERSHNTDSRYYKDGLSAAKPIKDLATKKCRRWVSQELNLSYKNQQGTRLTRASA